jgi:glycosyltransferase involved in cell wall biosynthesis
MFFSIVIPLYNKKDYIRRAILSVLSQTHPDFELIVIDDGSTDGSAEVVELIDDHRLKLIRQANGGVSKARNLGVKASCAEWVAFLDADDEYKPDFLKVVASFMLKYNQDQLSMIGANYFIGDEAKTAVNDTVISGVHDYFELFTNQKSPNHSSTTVVNKYLFFEVGGFPEGIKQFEDWITWFKLACVGNFGFINIPLGKYHMVEGSVSRSKRDMYDFFQDAEQLPRIALMFIDKYKLSSSRKENAKKRVSEFSLNISLLLAHGDARLLAIKMLKYVLFGTLILNWRKVLHLLLQIGSPQFIKTAYRKLRLSLLY